MKQSELFPDVNNSITGIMPMYDVYGRLRKITVRFCEEISFDDITIQHKYLLVNDTKFDLSNIGVYGGQDPHNEEHSRLVFFIDETTDIVGVNHVEFE